MKKEKFITLLFMLLIVGSIYAQKNPKQRAIADANDLKTKLSLTTQQTQNIEMLMVPYYTSLDELKHQLRGEKSIDARKQIGETAKLATEQFNQKLQNILTPAQKEEKLRLESKKQ